MDGFRTPSQIKLHVDWQAYSSGIKHINLEGDSLGVIAALRAIASGEGLGVPREYRMSVNFCDSGQMYGSIYAVESPLFPVKGREVTEVEALRVGLDILEGLGVKVRRVDPVDGEE